ncbi:SDR family NAD(P)-dependent oxidoreductase [Cognatishimia activa]|uniref:Diacetyl reductase [(S)-acetoin forming] n=1 Tax=Cognatishimia activa TaxID=1715691 RepID=A0A0N7MC93_9RHOB|nr:SDR family NAD(P)-dependent oxidoreductase [Cognatishimia activa]CUJ17646.1 Diacetyl reductase [(S)-acetoin forming] [Cognatishimia activa]CUK27568.1 Diacetyl reductase [(S)-acetoin forming] [Cognatishimia activa]
MKLNWKSAKPRVAYVTGAASGIGFGLSNRLLELGISVAAFDLEFGENTKSKLADSGKASATVRFYTCDITETAQLEQVIKEAKEELGTPDLVINSAGIAACEPAENLSTELFNRVVDVNLKGSWNVVKAVLPHMERGGHIALISSLAGHVPNFGYSAYCASKFGVSGLAQVLQLELPARGIDVTVVSPGTIQTPLVGTNHINRPTISERLRNLAGTLPLERAVDLILGGLSRRKKTIVPGTLAKAIALANSVFPGLFRVVARFLLVRISKNNAS